MFLLRFPRCGQYCSTESEEQAHSIAAQNEDRPPLSRSCISSLTTPGRSQKFIAEPQENISCISSLTTPGRSQSSLQSRRRKSKGAGIAERAARPNSGKGQRMVHRPHDECRVCKSLEQRDIDNELKNRNNSCDRLIFCQACLLAAPDTVRRAWPHLARLRQGYGWQPTLVRLIEWKWPVNRPAAARCASYGGLQSAEALLRVRGSAKKRRLVPLAGLEPARCCHHLILSQARMTVAGGTTASDPSAVHCNDALNVADGSNPNTSFGALRPHPPGGDMIRRRRHVLPASNAAGVDPLG